MFLLDQFPDPNRLRPTAANESYRQQFYSRWGKENCIVCAASRQIEFPPYTQRLSVKTVVGGSERYEIDGRTITLDDDNYLIINDGRKYGSAIAARYPVQTFSIFFAPGFPEDVASAVLSKTSDFLDRGCESAPRAIEFSEHLRPHDRIVSPVLRYLRHHAQQRLGDDAWYEEQLVFLFERMLESQHHTNALVCRLPLARPATRREVFRRIALATDLIHGNYRQKLRLDELARASHLSKYHFIRLFRMVHGHTPHAFLQRKRATVAKRLLETTDFAHGEVATLAGFDNRTTMFRHLRRLTGLSGQQLRHISRRARQVSTDSGTRMHEMGEIAHATSGQ